MPHRQSLPSGQVVLECSVTPATMTVLFANTSGQMGGAEASLLALLEAFRKSHPNWNLFLLLGEDGPFANMAEKHEIKVLILPLPSQLSRMGIATPLRIGLVHALRALTAILRYRARLLKAIRTIKPDIVHSNGLKMHVLSASISRRALGGATLRLCQMHDSLRNRPAGRWIFKLLAHRFDCIVANSESTARELRHLFGNRSTVHRVYNGISTERFSPTGPQLDLDILSNLRSVDSHVVRIGLVAAFARWKGHTSYMRALSILPSGLPIRAYVIGGAIYNNEGAQYTENELKSLARQLCPDVDIGFTGVVPNMEDAYRALDIVVHASTQPEPFGMVLIEAMACGRAVLASQGGGVDEIIVHEKNGLLHNSGDAVTLASQIELLVLDPDLRLALGQGGRAAVTAHFQSSMAASGFAAIYDEMLNGSKPST